MDHFLFLRGYFRVQRNLFNYLWNIKTLISTANIREGICKYEQFESLKVCASQSVQKVPWIMRSNLYLQRWENSKKKAWTIKIRIWTHPFAKRLKRVCLIVTRRELGQSPKGGHSALQKCHSVLLDAKHSSMCGCVLDSLSRVFWSGPCI